jgi:uncharacterized membrane protein
MSTVERFLGNLLRAGVVLAGVMVSVGALLYLAGHGAERPDYGKFHAQPIELRSVGRLLGSAPSLDGPGIIQLGILVLIATPIARVAFSVGVFARAGDRRYVAITGVVLAVLAYSLFGNH